MKCSSHSSIVLLLLCLFGYWNVHGEIGGGQKYPNGFSMMDVILQCLKKDSTIKILANVQECFGAIEISDSDSRAGVLDSFMDKFCTKKEETKKCSKPLSSLLKTCSPYPSPYDDADTEGYFMASLDLTQELACVEDNELSNELLDALFEDSLAAISCMWNHMDVLVNGAARCFVKKLKFKTQRTLCDRTADAFSGCLIGSLHICKDKKAERFVSTLMEKGLKRIYAQHLTKCDEL